jgi:putative FmdB family regulatory protein
MPTYEYRCPEGHQFEHFYRKMSDATSELPCPTCGKEATRMLTGGAGLVFKGSGFYLTDYGKNAHRKSGSGGPSAPAGESSGGDKSSSDSGSSGSSSGSESKSSSESKGGEGKGGESKSSESKSGDSKSSSTSSSNSSNSSTSSTSSKNANSPKSDS